jgi:hypothetical protein
VTTVDVLGIFVGIPLAICAVITAAVCAWERFAAGRRNPEATSAPDIEPQRSADVAPSGDGQPEPENTDQEESRD